MWLFDVGQVDIIGWRRVKKPFTAEDAKDAEEYQRNRTSLSG